VTIVHKFVAAFWLEVKRYRKPDGYVTRFWAVYVGGELLAVTVYRKGAIAIADLLMRTR
jgi:hypothetical protein